MDITLARGSLLLGYEMRPTDGTPIEICIWLVTYPLPKIILVFSTDGWKACTAFRKLYTNYRRIFELLLKPDPIRLVDLQPYPSGLKDRKRNVLKQLDTYFPVLDNWEFAESHSEYRLHFEVQLHSDADENQMYAAFSTLAVLYDSCHHYLRSRKDFDRILKHYIHRKKAGTIT